MKKAIPQSDADKVLRNEASITKIMGNRSLAEFLDTAKLFFQMLKDYFSGRYKELPVGTITAIIGSLAYVFCPVDLIPDFIPFIGYLDDAAVFAACIKLTKYDTQQYKAYREKDGAAGNP